MKKKETRAKSRNQEKSLNGKPRIQPGKCAKCEKGSFTVEAAVIVPLFLFMVITASATGFSILQEVRSKTEDEKTAHIWVVDDFYLMQDIGSAVGEILD